MHGTVFTLKTSAGCTTKFPRPPAMPPESMHWFEPQGPKFQPLVLASCGMFTQGLGKIGLLPFPMGNKISILGDCLTLHDP